MWACSSSECLEGSGHDGVSKWIWVRVNVGNYLGGRVRKACCHNARMGFSEIMGAWGEM